MAYLDALYWNALGLGRGIQGTPQSTFLTVILMDAVLTVVTGILALTLAFRREHPWGARPLALALAAWSYLVAYSGIIMLLRPADQGSPARALFAGHFLVVELLGLAALVRFTAEFPAPLAPSDTTPPDALPVGFRGLQHLRRWLLTPAAPWLMGGGLAVVLLGLNKAMGRAAEDAGLWGLMDLVRFGALAVVVANLRRSYLMGSRESRRRLHWLAVGFASLLTALSLIIGGNVLFTATGWSIPVVNWRPLVLDLGVMGLLWGATMGVLYDGALQPGRIGRHLVIAAAALLLALLLAAGLEALFSDALLARVSLPRGTGTVVAFLLVGVAYVRWREVLDSVLSQAWGGAPREART